MHYRVTTFFRDNLAAATSNGTKDIEVPDTVACLTDASGRA